MRVMYLNPTGQLGGAETSMLAILASLRRAEPSWPLQVVMAADGPLAAAVSACGATTCVVPFPSALARLGEHGAASASGGYARLAAQIGLATPSVASYVRRLRGAIRLFGPDLIQTNGLKMHLLAAWATNSIPLVWHLHDYLGPRPFTARLLRWNAARCATVIANSSSVAADARTTMGSCVRIVPVHNAVDLERFAPCGDRVDLDALAGLPPALAGTVRVGLLGTFARWKGHETFLRALAQLPRTLPVRAYVIGGSLYQTEGSQYSLAELRQLVSSFDLSDRVGFTGFVRQPETALRALDIVVHASTSPEPFGLVIAEAMACGRAVVVSGAGGAAELVTPGADALTHTPGDVRELAARIAALAADPPLRERLGRAARATAERDFDQARLAQDLVPLYRGGDRDMMRLLHVYSGNLYGGIESILLTLTRQRATCPELESEVALCFEGRLIGELEAEGTPVHRLGEVRVSRPHSVRRARRALTALLETGRFDRVICHGAWPYAVFARTVRRADLPLVFWVHDVLSGRHWTERWAKRTTPDLAIANSHFTAASIRALYPTTPLAVVYAPVDTAPSRLTPMDRCVVRAELDTPQDAVVIVQASRMDAWKGHAVLLEALAALRDRPEWVCWQVGGAQRPLDTAYVDSLRDLASRLRLSDRVRFVGERTDVPRLLAAADIHCQPNISPEPFGIAFIEALAAGLPVVTSAIGGAIEIVDDSCGRLVSASDPVALSAALRGLAGDPEERARLGAAGRIRAHQLCNPTGQLKQLHATLVDMVGVPARA